MQYPQQLSLLTIAQVMDLLQLKRTKIYHLIKSEGLPVQYFGRSVRIRPDALDAWLKAREQLK